MMKGRACGGPARKQEATLQPAVGSTPRRLKQVVANDPQGFLKASIKEYS